MATQSPFPFVDTFVGKVGQALQPPQWVIDEIQHRLVLMLNHVLMQEPEAQDRLKRQTGRVIEASWRIFVVRLVVTPAGLLDLAPADAASDLTLVLAEDSPLALTQAALRGDKPPVRIAGDVQLAAEVNWLVDNVRWDLEEDLSRLVGDAPAHTVAQAARWAAESLRKFAGPPPAGPGDAGPPGGGKAGA